MQQCSTRATMVPLVVRATQAERAQRVVPPRYQAAPTPQVTRIVLVAPPGVLAAAIRLVVQRSTAEQVVAQRLAAVRVLRNAQICPHHAMGRSLASAYAAFLTRHHAAYLAKKFSAVADDVSCAAP